MATVQKIYEEMQRMAPLELAESWDNPGLLVDCGGEVSRVLVALDVTAETLEEAEQNGCQLIEFVSTYEDALLGVSSLQSRDTLLRVVLQQLGRRVGNFREKDSRIASKCRIETFVINL